MIPRHPTPADLREHELELLDRLVAEQQQPEVTPWSRWNGFLHRLDRARMALDARYREA